MSGVTKASFQTYHTTDLNPPNPPTTVVFNRTASSFTRYEMMNDVVGNKGGENPVDYVIVQSMRGSRVAFTYSTNDGTQYGGSGYGPWEEIEFGHIHGKVPVVQFSNLGDQATRAVQHITTLVPTSVLFPNFILELKDWKDLPDVMRRLKTNWELLASFGTAIRPRSIRRYLEWFKIPRIRKELIAFITGKKLANAHLMKEFGIDPFISDLRKLFSILDNMDKKILFLKSQIGKRYRAGYREDIPTPAGLNTTTFVGTTTLECEYYRAQFNVSMEVSHDIPELDSLGSRIKVAMAMLGLNNPAAVIWEAIPYSFLVDWFINVQDLVAQFGTLPFLTGKITVHKVSTSVHQRATIAHYIDVYGNKKVLLDRYNLHRFWRNPLLPTLSFLTLKSALTDDQLLLGVALLRQRLSI